VGNCKHTCMRIRKCVHACMCVLRETVSIHACVDVNVYMCVCINQDAEEVWQL